MPLTDTKLMVPTTKHQNEDIDSFKRLPWGGLHRVMVQSYDYELFNHNNLSIRYWSWNYRGCWHQTFPSIDTRWAIYTALIPTVTPSMGNTSLFLVTTSQSLQWVIYAPAAFLRCASRFSGCLSGIEPWFPVTRYKHGSPIPNHRRLISQYFEWPTVAEAYGPLSSLDSSEDTRGDRFKERKNTSYDAFSKY